MKIILSRKGFDSSYGGMPSPILPDGTLLSLLVPCRKDKKDLYKDLKYTDKNGKSFTYEKIIEDLNPSFNFSDYSHVDPDLREGIKVEEKDKNWTAAFGQADSALSALDNENVKEGDLFLFFGWFKKTERIEEETKQNKKEIKFQYNENAPDLHVLYGYLQIGEMIRKEKNNLNLVSKFYLENHPHNAESYWEKEKNCIYVASKNLSIGGEVFPEISGAGVFEFDYEKEFEKPKYRLTALKKEGNEKENRTIWFMPDCFNKSTKIKFHSEKSWIDEEKHLFKSADIGQEFVIDIGESPNKKVVEWIKKLIVEK